MMHLTCCWTCCCWTCCCWTCCCCCCCSASPRTWQKTSLSFLTSQLSSLISIHPVFYLGSSEAACEIFSLIEKNWRNPDRYLSQGLSYKRMQSTYILKVVKKSSFHSAVVVVVKSAKSLRNPFRYVNNLYSSILYSKYLKWMLIT